MATPQPHITTVIIPQESKRPMNLKGMIARYLYHWPLYLIGLFFTLTIAVIYIQFAKPVYEINATLIIKDNKKSPEQQSALSEIDLLNSSKLVENEIEILKSNRLINQVVKELELDIVYQRKEGFDLTDLYNTGPVKLTLLQSDNPLQKAPGNFDKRELIIVIKDKNTFFLKNSDDELKEYAFNTPIKSAWGFWKLTPTDFLPDYKDADIKIAVLDTKELTLQYQKALEISIPNKLATSISLTLEDQVAQRGKDILNQLILNYNRFGIEVNENKAKATLAFLDNRLDSLTAELNIAEEGIEGYKSSRGLTDISTESKINLENIQDVERSLNDVNVKLSIIRDIENYLNSSKSGQIPATMGISDPGLNSLIESLSSLRLKKARLLAISPETNPDFDPINKQIEATTAAIQENVANIKLSLLNTRIQLQSFNSALDATIKKIPQQERQLANITRQQAVKEGLYTYLLQKREELAANYADVSSSSQVIDLAYAGKPKFVKKTISLFLAILLGLGVPFLIIYARNLLNDTIIDVQEIKDSLDIPIIGEIFYKKSQDLISQNTTKTTIISEQLRTLRTKLYLQYGIKTKGKVTLVTSSIPGEGKSFISSNLSLALAQTDRKTVLLQMDLRKSISQDNINQRKEDLGISDFLNGETKLQDIINQSELNPNLYIIGNGTVVNNASELLEKDKLKELIATLQSTFNDIIIESPPIHLVPDAMILSRLTDVTLYIIKQGYTKKTELAFLKEIQAKNQLNNIHIVFNGIKKSKYGYGYNYMYNYYNKIKNDSIFNDFWDRF